MTRGKSAKIKRSKKLVGMKRQIGLIEPVEMTRLEFEELRKAVYKAEKS